MNKGHTLLVPQPMAFCWFVMQVELPAHVYGAAARQFSRVIMLEKTFKNLHDQSAYQPHVLGLIHVFCRGSSSSPLFSISITAKPSSMWPGAVVGFGVQPSKLGELADTPVAVGNVAAEASVSHGIRTQAADTSPTKATAAIVDANRRILDVCLLPKLPIVVVARCVLKKGARIVHEK